jgi:hypothetical protein
MSDRCSQEIFARLFEACAEEETDTEAGGAATRIAHKMWPVMFGLDFSIEEMGVDGSLLTLGLASARPDAPDATDDEDEPTVVYRTKNLKGWQ